LPRPLGRGYKNNIKKMALAKDLVWLKPKLKEVHHQRPEGRGNKIIKPWLKTLPDGTWKPS